MWFHWQKRLHMQLCCSSPESDSDIRQKHQDWMNSSAGRWHNRRVIPGRLTISHFPDIRLNGVTAKFGLSALFSSLIKKSLFKKLQEFSIFNKLAQYKQSTVLESSPCSPHLSTARNKRGIMRHKWKQEVFYFES